MNKWTLFKDRTLNLLKKTTFIFLYHNHRLIKIPKHLLESLENILQDVFSGIVRMSDPPLISSTVYEYSVVVVGCGWEGALLETK
jgi:hypothetical protein